MNKGQSIASATLTVNKSSMEWASNPHDLTECISMEHTRAHPHNILPVIGDSFVTNRRDPILTVIEGTKPGNHDTLMAACDRHRYVKQFGLKDYQESFTLISHSLLPF